MSVFEPEPKLVACKSPQQGGMAIAKEAFITTLLVSFSAGECVEKPFRHWLLKDCLPREAVARVLALPFPVPDLGGVSGKRDIHNPARRYFDVQNRARYPVCESFCQAFQDKRVTDDISNRFCARLGGTYLRVEFAQDTDGFWLEPHTDLGVKRFTMLLYLSPDAQHETLGTDIYDADQRHVGAVPFTSNAAMVFVPSDGTYHGFEPRKIEGVRKSAIINYVTSDWGAREQLAFPDQPV